MKAISHKRGREDWSFTQLVSGESPTAGVIQRCDAWPQHECKRSLVFLMLSGLVLLGSGCFPTPVIWLGTTTKKLILALDNDPAAPHCGAQAFRGHLRFFFFFLIYLPRVVCASCCRLMLCNPSFSQLKHKDFSSCLKCNNPKPGADQSPISRPIRNCSRRPTINHLMATFGTTMTHAGG